jgi:hypothetical protein
MKRPAAQFVLDNEKAARRRSVGPFPAKPNERAERGPKEILSVSIAREGVKNYGGSRFIIARGILGYFDKRQYDRACCLLAVSRGRGTIFRRSLVSVTGDRSRRIADAADHGLGRLNWAESGPT